VELSDSYYCDISLEVLPLEADAQCTAVSEELTHPLWCVLISAHYLKELLTQISFPCVLFQSFELTGIDFVTFSSKACCYVESLISFLRIYSTVTMLQSFWVPSIATALLESFFYYSYHILHVSAPTGLFWKVYTGYFRRSYFPTTDPLFLFLLSIVYFFLRLTESKNIVVIDATGCNPQK
jgi:hypothetical protein